MPGLLATAHRLLDEAADALSAAAGPGATDDEKISVLLECEAMTRRLDQLTVATVADLQRRGTFAERGYTSAAAALGDLLSWERFEARRRTTAAEQVHPRTNLDGAALPARLPATAAMFAAGRIGMRHIEVIAKLLASKAAGRLAPEIWADAETRLADWATEYSPSDLQNWGAQLIEKLDQDGPAPDDDRPPPQTNELHMVRHRDRPGGKLTARFDDAAMFDAIATVLDAKSKPITSDDTREPAQRAAEALAEVCGHALDHGPTSLVPETGGRRPHLNVVISLEDLENRARSAMLDLGGTLSPESLRMLACDCAVVPIVLNGRSQPLDVGRATRTIPDGLRRAVAVRDRGCAHPGCDRPASWCEIHHIQEWEHGGETTLDNLVMVCRRHHRLIHHSGWTVRIRDGIPEFIPPAWIDSRQRPRRRPDPRSGLRPPEPGPVPPHVPIPRSPVRGNTGPLAPPIDLDLDLPQGRPS